jgi:hypothetical protein
MAQLIPFPVTTPFPVPPPETVIVGPAGLKTAVTDRLVVKATVVHVAVVPVHASVQPLKALLPAAAAVRFSALPLATGTEQVPEVVWLVTVQLMPVPVTVPLPVPAPTMESFTAALTFRVILIVCGVLSAPVAATLRDAVYVPGLSAAIVGCRTMTFGVTLVFNVTVSQPFVCSELYSGAPTVINPSEPAPEFVIVTVEGSGSEVPSRPVNATAVDENARCGRAITVTEMFVDTPPDDAVTLVVPGPIALTSPDDDTETIEALPEDHDTARPVRRTPVADLATALTCAESPTFRLRAPLLTSKDVTSTGVSVIVDGVHVARDRAASVASERIALRRRSGESIVKLPVDRGRA